MIGNQVWNINLYGNWHIDDWKFLFSIYIFPEIACKFF